MRHRYRVTYRQLEQLLLQLGFAETGRDDKAVVYQHAAADSLILLPAQAGECEARQADLMSVEQHLVGWGHLEEGRFEDLLQTEALPVESR